MRVNHNHSCNLCSRQRTCFVFRDFTMLFAVCRSCYEQFTQQYRSYEVVNDFCSFCEKNRDCRVLSGFDDSMFFTDIRVCTECAEEIVEAVSLHGV